MTRHIARFGADAILVTEPGQSGARLLAACRDLPGVIEATAGADSVLLTFATWEQARTAIPGARTAAVPDEATATGASVDIMVRYDGIDLPEVADGLSLSTDAVIARHVAGDYRVAFCGFAPGFAYLAGLDPVLRLPRLPSPRARVPAGSVAIADTWCGIYPRATPGGWRILGTTDAVLFDPGREPPALLTTGTRVRFLRAAQ